MIGHYFGMAFGWLWDDFGMTLGWLWDDSWMTLDWFQYGNCRFSKCNERIWVNIICSTTGLICQVISTHHVTWLSCFTHKNVLDSVYYLNFRADIQTPIPCKLSSWFLNRINLQKIWHNSTQYIFKSDKILKTDQKIHLILVNSLATHKNVLESVLDLNFKLGIKIYYNFYLLPKWSSSRLSKIVKLLVLQLDNILF